MMAPAFAFVRIDRVVDIFSPRKKTVEMRIQVGNTENSSGSLMDRAIRIVISEAARARAIARSRKIGANGITIIMTETIAMIGKNKSV